jgi:hypothetical protein
MKNGSVRAKPISHHLALSDAVEIWRRRAMGEAQQVLAAAYRVNPGRIAEVLSGERFPEARVIAERGSKH